MCFVVVFYILNSILHLTRFLVLIVGLSNRYYSKNFVILASRSGVLQSNKKYKGYLLLLHHYLQSYDLKEVI